MYQIRNTPLSPEYRHGERPLDDYLKIHAKRIPEKAAMIYYGTQITYQEFDNYVDRMATLLTKLGIKKGDAVAIYMQNCPQFSISFFAIQRIGAVAAPFSPMFKEWDLEYELNELSARVIIANGYLYPIVKKVISSTKLEHVIVASLTEFLPEEPSVPFLFEGKEPDCFDDAILFLDALKVTSPDVPKVERGMDDVSFPAFGGNLMATILCPDTSPQIGTIRPGVYKKPIFQPGRAGEILCEPVHTPAEWIRTQLIRFAATELRSTRILKPLSSALRIIALLEICLKCSPR